jgi:hypothetical protein
MSEEALVFEVGESGFDRYVIDNSHKLLVARFCGIILFDNRNRMLRICLCLMP